MFDEPKGVADMLNNLCDIKFGTAELPDAANIPVLGLSNKAIQAVQDDEPAQNGDDDEREAVDFGSTIKKSTLDLDHPPFEDHLARHLLWPESEKLYGHGYEISAVATLNDGKLVATACRASSIDHAVIRLYDTQEWLEIKPPLKAHSLTVTSLQFSPDSKFLLSVGRDRQWVIWERSDEGVYALKYNNVKGHTRMILGASWTSLQPPTFLTAGRDKAVKVWQITEDDVQLKTTVKSDAAVTAVQCNRSAMSSALVFAYGTEDGQVVIGAASSPAFEPVSITKIDARLSPARTVNQLAWRPGRDGGRKEQLAVVSDDSSVRIYSVGLEGV